MIKVKKKKNKSESVESVNLASKSEVPRLYLVFLLLWKSYLKSEAIHNPVQPQT